MIHVLASIELQAGRREDFLRELNQVAVLVRAEEGCLEYSPTIDLATGLPVTGAPRENIVTIVEKWESIEHLERHLVAPHMHAYRPKVRDMIVRVSLQILQPA